MPNLLLDQNIPGIIANWLQNLLPEWQVRHVKQLGIEGKPDEVLYRWAQQHEAIIATFDEDFADARMYQLGRHHGIIRLRVWPTTIENTKHAFERLLENLPPSEWPRSLIIIDNHKIRIRRSDSIR